MKQLRTLLGRWRAKIGSHPFFFWLGSDRMPLDERLHFAPVMFDFIMGFADMNKWYFPYPEPKSKLERAINEHTEEDRTHSRLFIHNYRELALDRAFGWGPSQTLWWLYYARETAPVRRFGLSLMHSAVTEPDPLLRFALMEAIETCGTVFFAATAQVADRLSRETGTAQYYFGSHHLARENGHLQTDESAFFEERLTAAQRAVAEARVASVFEQFVTVLDELLRVVKALEKDRRALLADLDRRYALSLRSPAGSAAPAAPLPLPRSGHNPLRRALDAEIERLEAHPLFAWLGSHPGGDPCSGLDPLRAFVPLWAVDIVGYRDFCEIAASYPEPQKEPERRFNAWMSELGSHGTLYLQDFRELGLDSDLGWRSSDTVEFCFLDPRTEVHRRNLARVLHYTFRYPDPVLRYWLLATFEAMGEPLFSATRMLIGRAAETRAPLNYWSNRHELASPSGRRATLEARAWFESQPLSQPQTAIGLEMIRTLGVQFAEQYSLSLEVAQTRALFGGARAQSAPSQGRSATEAQVES